MPYPLGFFDGEFWSYNTGEGGDAGPWLLKVGSNFQAGDMRVIIVGNFFDYDSTYGATTGSFTTFPGWTKVYDQASVHDYGSTGYSSFYGVGVFTQVLTTSSTDGELGMSWSGAGYHSFSAAFFQGFTVRNPNVGQAWSSVGQTAVWAWQPSDGVRTLTAPSVTTGDGALICSYVVQSKNQTDQMPAPSTPAGMTTLFSRDKTHNDFFDVAVLLAGQSFTGTGTSGVKSSTSIYVSTYTGVSLFLFTNPDVTATLGVATAESDTATATTASLLNKVTFPLGLAQQTETVRQVFSPLTGFHISDPQILPGAPVTASRISWQATTYAAGSSVTVETSIDGGQSWQVATNGGAVPLLDRGDANARTILTRTTLTRANVSDPTPRVQALKVEISTDDAADEMVPLGMFVINQATVTQSGGIGSSASGGSSGGDGVTGSGGGATGGGTALEISGVDLSRVISRNSWDDIYIIPAGTNYATAIRDMIANRLPGTTFNFATTEHTTPKLIFGTQQGSDPWQDAQDLAAAIGYELFFDAAGVCTLRQIPDPAAADPVWEFTDESNPTITALTRTLSDVTTFNKVIVQGESTGNTAPITATAIDTDESSPTYYLGPYGTVPVYFTSPMITTQQQAQQAADALLLAVKGASESVELSVVPNPALEPGDVVTVTVGDAKIQGTFLINQTTIPLSAASAMTATCYRQQ